MLDMLFRAAPAPPPPPPPEPDNSALIFVLTLMIGVAGFLVLSMQNHMDKIGLQEQLAAAQARVRMLQAQLGARVPPSLHAADGADGAKPVRIWMDGAFDMMHYGHVNAFRQGRALGTHLVVGVNDDESITRCKGPPVMSNEERLAMVEGCKVRQHARSHARP